MWQGSIKGIKPANIPSITVPDTRHGTAWDCDQYQGPGLWHKSFYLMTPSISWHNVTQCVTLSRMLSRGREWLRISLIPCMIVEGHIQNRSKNCITIATLRHLHDLNIAHSSTDMSQQVSNFRFAEYYAWVTFIHCDIKWEMMSTFEEDIFWKWYSVIHSMPPNWDNDLELIWI